MTNLTELFLYVPSGGVCLNKGVRRVDPLHLIYQDSTVYDLFGSIVTMVQPGF